MVGAIGAVAALAPDWLRPLLGHGWRRSHGQSSATPVGVDYRFIILDEIVAYRQRAVLRLAESVGGGPGEGCFAVA